MSSALLKMPRFVKLYQVPLSGASLAGGTKFILIRMRFLIPSQSALRHPRPHQMFSSISQKFLFYRHVLLNLKKEKLLLDRIQQLSSNSWEDTVVVVTQGPENTATGGRERKRDGCSKLFGVGWDRSGQDSKSQLKRESAPICLNLPICSEQIHLEVEWGLKQQKLGCL